MDEEDIYVYDDATLLSKLPSGNDEVYGDLSSLLGEECLYDDTPHALLSSPAGAGKVNRDDVMNRKKLGCGILDDRGSIHFF